MLLENQRDKLELGTLDDLPVKWDSVYDAGR